MRLYCTIFDSDQLPTTGTGGQIFLAEIGTSFADSRFFGHVAYNDLPYLPPSIDIEPKAVLKACVKARAALAASTSEGADSESSAVRNLIKHTAER